MKKNGPGSIKVGYLCSYFPVDLYTDLGFKVVLLSEVENTQKAKIQLSCNLCSYVRACETICSPDVVDAIVLTNCCNSKQRLYDIIKLNHKSIFVDIIDIPRESNEIESTYYINNCIGSIEKISSYFNIELDKGVIQNALNGGIKPVRSIDHNSILITGSAVNQHLKTALEEQLNNYNVIYNICGERMLLDGKGFNNIACVRSGNFLSWFNNFIDKNREKLAGIVFISSKNCDISLFKVPAIKDYCLTKGVKILFLEEEFARFGKGQLSTRVEAFIESIELNTTKNLAPQYSGSQSEKTNQTFKNKIKMVNAILQNLPLTAIQKVVRNQFEIFYDKIWTDSKNVIWTNMVMPVEIFYAAGLIPINMELVSGWLASLQLSKNYINVSEGSGLSPSLCSYHKATIGLLEESGLPKPKGAVISSHICDGGPGVAQLMEHKYQTNTFIVNVPFKQNQTSKEYLINEYERLIKWIEKYTNKPFDFNKLKEALKLSNMAREYWIKAFEIRKGEPMFEGHLSLRNLFGTTFLFGSKIGVEVAKSYYDQLQSMKKSLRHDNQVKRMLWIHFAPLYNNSIMEYLEKELKCVIVMDITGYVYWPDLDVEKPLESMANKSLSHFYLGEPESRMDLYKKLIIDYRIDGIIHFMHMGCRAIPGSSHQVKSVADKLGIPMLELTGDCIDPRGFSKSQMQLRIEAFNETLRSKDYVFRN